MAARSDLAFRIFQASLYLALIPYLKTLKQVLISASCNQYPLRDPLLFSGSHNYW